MNKSIKKVTFCLFLGIMISSAWATFKTIASYNGNGAGNGIAGEKAGNGIENQANINTGIILKRSGSGNNFASIFLPDITYEGRESTSLTSLNRGHESHGVTNQKDGTGSHGVYRDRVGADNTEVKFCSILSFSLNSDHGVGNGFSEKGFEKAFENYDGARRSIAHELKVGFNGGAQGHGLTTQDGGTTVRSFLMQVG